MSQARVHRSKSKGRRVRERRRLILAAGAALSAAIGSTLSVGNLMGVDVAAAAAAKAQSFMDLMHRRSPGVRTEAHLTKVRAKHSRVLAEKPLPELPEIPAVAAYTPPVELFAPPLQPTFAAFPEAPQLVLAAVPPPLFYAPPLGGIFAAPPPGGAGGPPGPPGGPGGPPQQPPPAVPEPATWAMMMLGLGISGWALRRRSRSGAAA